jgi:hypothetical protein
MPRRGRLMDFSWKRQSPQARLNRQYLRDLEKCRNDFFIDKLRCVLRNSDGMSRTAISHRLSGSQRIAPALATLERRGEVRREMRRGRGRPVEFWVPIS